MRRSIMGYRRANITVGYYVRKQASKRSGEYPILMRISSGRERITIGQIGLSLSDPSFLVNNKITSACPSAGAFNDYLITLKVEAESIGRDLLAEGRFSLEGVKDSFLLAMGKRKIPTIGETFKELIEGRLTDRLNNGDLAKRTFYSWKRSYRLLQNFFHVSLKVRDLPLGKLDENLFRQYTRYLLDKIGYKPNSAASVLWQLKALSNYAVEMGYIQRTKLSPCKIERERSNVEHLTIEEVRSIASLKIENEGISTTRDMFIFACLTGLTYGDIQSLQKKHFVVVKGRLCLKKHR